MKKTKIEIDAERLAELDRLDAMHTMPTYLVAAFEVIDASLFNGDDFARAATRQTLHDYMVRWKRGLAEKEGLTPGVPLSIVGP